MDHTTVLLSSTVINNLCNVVFLFLPLVFRQGPHLRMIFFPLRFSPLLLVASYFNYDLQISQMAAQGCR